MISTIFSTILQDAETSPSPSSHHNNHDHNHDQDRADANRRARSRQASASHTLSAGDSAATMSGSVTSQRHNGKAAGGSAGDHTNGALAGTVGNGSRTGSDCSSGGVQNGVKGRGGGPSVQGYGVSCADSILQFLIKLVTVRLPT